MKERKETKMAKKAKKKVKKSAKITTFTMQLPIELHKRLKARRLKTGDPMGTIIIRGIEKELKRAA